MFLSKIVLFTLSFYLLSL